MLRGSIPFPPANLSRAPRRTATTRERLVVDTLALHPKGLRSARGARTAPRGEAVVDGK